MNFCTLLLLITVLAACSQETADRQTAGDDLAERGVV